MPKQNQKNPINFGTVGTSVSSLISFFFFTYYQLTITEITDVSLNRIWRKMKKKKEHGKPTRCKEYNQIGSS